MKISQLINEDFWVGNDRKGKARVRGDRFGWNGGEDPNNNSDVHIYVPGRQNKTKSATTEPRSTRKDKRTHPDSVIRLPALVNKREIVKYHPRYPDRTSKDKRTHSDSVIRLPALANNREIVNTSALAHNNHSKLGLGGKIAATTAAVGGAAVIGKKLWDKHHATKNVPLTHSDRAKAFATKHGKKVAAGTLAALGAGVGVKALLKYLRKKKES